MPIRAIDPTKPILGYVLKNRVGAGGYGEVWAAEAPGGLPKAVKFVFGYHDDDRAQSELKALNRIRAARHPFLLSLERIDVVDGQLVVITELADMCLKTRFDQCVESGLNGIPRAELLGYLRDAANALDFLSAEFHLQHLDIKPENLLLVSGHVKVADFGLVKDLHEANQSMLSGLTPAYAPPELFDGKPGKSSDQYSLAILFQEMLTGVRSFDGTTAAQLAAQHIKERPNLKPLPREDQATISRALSKDPELRFPNCSDMIEALTRKDLAASGGSAPRTRTKLRDVKRSRRRARPPGDSTSTMTGTTPFGVSSADVESLETIVYDENCRNIRPTLLIGMGGTGTKILTQLRRKLTDRIGHRDSLPAIKFLALDTDPAELAAACHSGNKGALSYQETFALPLRRPEDYRADAKMHLTWLSRRWIYNVPKSLRTEGIRTLGRLAMATHIEPLAIRLRQVLSELVQTEGLAETANAVNLDPSPIPRVILVGSISGGTCSGMGIDIAYIVRTILQQLDVQNEEVIGFFTHSSKNICSDGDLTIANTLAFLSELYHFSCVEEYPGDETCGIPASTDGTTTFANTYLVHLGSEVTTATYRSQVDSLAEYLFQSCASPSSAVLDSCRSNEAETKGMPLRTLGLASSSNEAFCLVSAATALLQRDALEYWTSANPERVDIAESASLLLTELGLDLDGLIQLVHDTVAGVYEDPAATVTKMLVECIDLNQRPESRIGLHRVVVGNFGLNAIAATAETSPLVARLGPIRANLIEEKLPLLVDSILEFVDEPGGRLAKAKAVTTEIQEQLKGYRKQIEILLEGSSAKLAQSLDQVLRKEAVGPRNVAAYCGELAAALLQRFSLEGVRDAIVGLLAFVPQALAGIDELQEQLDSVLDRIDFDATHDIGLGDDAIVDDLLAAKMKCVSALIPMMRERVEQQVQHNMLDFEGGLRAALADLDARLKFADQFVAATRATITEQLRELDLQAIFEAGDISVEELAACLNRQALPRLLGCGGATRVVQGYPQHGKPPTALIEAVEEDAKQTSTVIPSTVGEAFVLVEVERVPLDNVSMHLLQNRPDSIEFASRLHTRTDIAWTPITSMR